MPAHPAAESEEVCPKIILDGAAVKVGAAGIGLTITVTTSLESDTQPIIIQATLYVLFALGLTEILVPNKPSVQFRMPPSQAVEVSVTELPIQIDGELGEITGLVGLVLTVTVAASLKTEVQPFIVQSTLYSVVAIGLTVIAEPDKPPVQFRVPPLQPLATKVTVPPPQIKVAFGVIVGLVGIGFTVIVTASLESEVQLFIVQATL